MLNNHREAFRLARLAQYDVLDTPPEREYDQLAELAAQLFQVPITLLSIVGKTEQWHKARHGLEICRVDRTFSLCAHTLEMQEPLVVLDATRDPRFRDNPLVLASPCIRFYAGAPLIDRTGAHLGALCLIDDQPRSEFGVEQRRLLSSLADLVVARLEKRREMRLGKAANAFACATGLAIVTTDAQGRISFWNHAAELMFGFTAEEAIGQSIQIVIPERFRLEHASGMARAALSSKAPFLGKTVEVVATRRDGSEFPVELTIAKWEGPTGQEFGAHIQDISARRNHDRKLYQLAHHDVLTGLLNRTGFRERAEKALADDMLEALLAFDLDGFKALNDTLGHAAGDVLLQMVALRMRSALDVDCDLARMGGDEFGLLVSGRTSPTMAELIAASVLDSLAAPFDVDGHIIKIGCSVGVALRPPPGSEVDEILAQADLALQAAKQGKGGAIRLFTAELATERVDRQAFREELRLATVRQEWKLFYQPQVRLADGGLVGVEALLRWRHPLRGLQPPAAFMPALETHLVSYEVGNWVIDEACRQLAAWREAGRDVPRMAVNLFASQVRAGTLHTVVSTALKRHALSPCDLELELTETIALQQDDAVLGTLHDLRQAGVNISFDDFGTGFASLSSLKQFPITRLKIDRSFVQDVCEEPHSAAIVCAVVSIGRSLGLEVVAEGVETEHQRAELMRLGCIEAQGYLFGRPQPGGSMFSGEDGPLVEAGPAARLAIAMG